MGLYKFPVFNVIWFSVFVYMSHSEFIKYTPGSLPIIFVVPHGGHLKPNYLSQISEHKGDRGTIELTEIVCRYIKEKTNKEPFVIINLLKSNILNANRGRITATTSANGTFHEETREAWDEFHKYITEAKEFITEHWGYGHLFDMHSNNRKGGFVQIGQRVSAAELKGGDIAIKKALPNSSVKYLIEKYNIDFVEITKGETSLGGLLSKRGVKSVPSPTYPSPPYKNDYFKGGWNTDFHGSKKGGVISATQIENYCNTINKPGSTRETYGHLLASAILEFMQIHYGFIIP